MRKAKLSKPLLGDKKKTVVIPDKGEYGASRPHGKHKGIDFALVKGTKVYALIDGLLENKRFNSQLEVWVSALNGSEQHRNVHLDRYARPNGRVKAGDLIGYTGDSGTPGSFHLHFERLLNDRGQLVHVDPTDYLLENDFTMTTIKSQGTVTAAGKAPIYNNAGEDTGNTTMPNDIIPFNAIRAIADGTIDFKSSYEDNVWVNYKNTEPSRATWGDSEAVTKLHESKKLAAEIIKL